ncbi:MAG: hydrogenase maturation nickel metallochaperone HypA [Planctomycetes bacterium]|nr:hydrogenase maturation nickel metallochaperone HypA [Planctomycetota bacterium]
MHELSICQSILDTALEEFRKVEPPPNRILKMRVVVGELRQIAPDFLQSAYAMLTEDTPAEGSELEIARAAIMAKCDACDWEGEIPKTDFRCPECKSSDIQVSGGMELYLDSLEVE